MAEICIQVAGVDTREKHIEWRYVSKSAVRVHEISFYGGDMYPSRWGGYTRGAY
ncbi:hypothetical protein [Bacillus sp. P14.5]|uniref:hypothetical protein n=1 Tax=Bacillus sp. P14.5 TaxID=1983400 RepID=UPI0019663F9A|nr:hypothetical protein [Bacillus sp. P14.5]